MSFIENVNDPYHRGFQSIRPFSEKLRFEILGHFWVSRTYFVKIVRVVKYIKMVNYNDGENGIFVISKKFEEIQGEIFRNQSAEFSPITIARTNLAPEVSQNSLRVVQTQAILFLQSMSEKVGSDVDWLWWRHWWRQERHGVNDGVIEIQSRSVWHRLCRIRLFSTMMSKMKWVWSGLPLNSSANENEISDINADGWSNL